MPIPTIPMNASRVGPASGVRSAFGNVSSPRTRALGLSYASRLSRFGTLTLKTVVAWPGSGIPPTLRPAPVSVWVTPSIAASVAGWCWATVRPSRSPTPSCNGAMIAAIASDTVIAFR